MMQYFESDDETETRPEFNLEPCTNQVPATCNMQEATDRTRIVTQPTMWKPQRASAVLPDSTASMVKNNENTMVDDLPAITTITKDYAKNLQNNNQNKKKEIGVVGQNVSGRLHGVDEMAQVASLKEIIAKYESDSPNAKLPKPEKPDDYDKLIKQLVDENSNLKTNLEMKAAALNSQEEHIYELLATNNQLNKKYQDMSEMKTELENQLKNTQKLLKEKETTLEPTLEAKNVDDQKFAEYFHKSQIELKVTHQNNVLLTGLNQLLENELAKVKREARQLRADFSSFSEAMKLAGQGRKQPDEQAAANLQSNVTILKKELAASLSQNYELKNERAASESQLRHEVANLKTAMQTQNKTLSSAMSQVERIKHDNSFLNMSLESVQATLAHELTKNVELTTRNAELESDKSLLELKNDNLKKDVEDLRKELERMERVNQDLLDTREAALQSVQQAEKFAKEQVEALPEADSQEKLLSTLSFQSEEIQRLTAAKNQLSHKLEETSLKNDELILELDISRGMASAITDGFHQIESKLKKEIGELKHHLNAKQKFLEEREAILESTLQAKKDANQKVEEIHKTKQEIQLAHQKNLRLTSINDQLQNELTELKRAMQEINLSLEFAETVLAEKLGENDELNIRNWDLNNEKSLLELNNKNLKKEAEDCRRNLERIEQEHQDLLDTRDEVLQSAKNAEKSAKEQVEALSEALAALQEATQHTQNSTKATKTEGESLKSGATKTEKGTKGNWVGKLFAKRKTREYEDGYADLLETTGHKMVEWAKKLQDHAKNIKAEGKALKKKAKTVQK
ncbi:hypothetical protein DAPPUDRAFT_251810 [Daphnia pulex]|uniref:Uncharacterized protein n=1 Tax=Daphnia pulex TaxID=6669 RepID=E9H162_DAPPU|nr:hypothetical protein DAPPUDRAFT_251810 [Daphnia pulex]|eukprot:EFX74580.1 hypothetical protein DAPPUDRAFT_251810 [Daphnia pulex]